MKFRAYGIVPNSYVDGPGVRLAIFFQGCLHHCEGCHNPESWPMYGGEPRDTEDVKRMIAEDPLLTGITLSGGEPFLQVVPALDLARFAHSRGRTVWCYTGYLYEQIEEWEDLRHDLLREIDVLVDGPFEQERMSLEIPWRGSANQRLIDVKASLAKGEVVLYECESLPA